MIRLFPTFCRPKYLHVRRRSRNGVVLIAALVCLLVVTSIVATMLQGALRARRELHAERDLRQTELLVEAGADRAAARLLSQPDFRGDVWDLPAESVAGHGDARVTTHITRDASINTLQLSVVAEYPLGRNSLIRRSHTFQIASPSTHP